MSGEAVGGALEVPGTGMVSSLLLRPDDAKLGYVLAHGAGAGMRHPFLEAMAVRLAARGVATLRYQFPYMERKRGRPDAPDVARHRPPRRRPPAFPQNDR